MGRAVRGIGHPLRPRRRPPSWARFPIDVREREMWAMGRRGAIVLLAGLAEWDAALLKRATLGVASEWTNRRASELSMDAAKECR